MAIAGLLLIVHAVVHLGVWLPAPKDTAPFDPAHSWLLGDVRGAARGLAIIACVAFALAGVLVLAGSPAGAVVTIVAAVVSLILIAVTFNPWLIAAAAIDAGIVVIAAAS